MGKHGISSKGTTSASKKKTKTKYSDTKNEQPIKTRRKTTKRDVISYENVPIDSYEQYSEAKTKFKRKKINKRILKRCLLIFAILVIIFLAVFIIANRQSLTWDNINLWFSEHIIGEDGSGYPATLSGTSVSKGNFTLVNGRPCYASDTSYIELNSNAGEIINSQISFNNPVIRGTRNNTIVYGVDGTGYMIHNSKKRTYKGSTEDSIYSADINDNGSYAIVTGGSDYLSVLRAYDNNSKQIYSYSFADYYVTCVSINYDGSGAVCCGFTTENGAEKTKIYVLDFTKEKSIKEYDLSESVIYDIFYLSDNIVSAVADDSVYTFELDSKDINKLDYESRILTDYTYNPDTRTFAIALSRSGDGHNCDIISFNSNGRDEFTINSSYKVDSISLYKGNLGILSENMAYILNEDGSVALSAEAGSDARTLLVAGSDKGYILGISEIRTIEFSK
ncbi:MAG: hypothetical protein IJV39_03105 [Ruminococcus sp.]|nr:hypothetical protein [Ruminococcus sp.]